MSDTPLMKAPEKNITRMFGTDPFLEGNLFNVNPFALMRQFTNDMDELFGRMPAETSLTADFRPAIEVKEEKGKLLVKADLPGVKKEDVKVTVANNVLTVEGERKQEKDEKREGYFRSERSFGRFLRSIPLPEGAKMDQASAQFADGVLEVAVPIPEVKQQRKEIPIEEGPKAKAAVH